MKIHHFPADGTVLIELVEGGMNDVGGRGRELLPGITAYYRTNPDGTETPTSLEILDDLHGRSVEEVAVKTYEPTASDDVRKAVAQIVQVALINTFPNETEDSFVRSIFRDSQRINRQTGKESRRSGYRLRENRELF